MIHQLHALFHMRLLYVFSIFYTDTLSCLIVAYLFLQGLTLAPIHLVVENEFHRAAPGGTGGVKTIGNYASVIKPCKLGFTKNRYIHICESLLQPCSHIR